MVLVIVYSSLFPVSFYFATQTVSDIYWSILFKRRLAITPSCVHPLLGAKY